MDIKIPEEAGYIISTLEENGYEAFVVGGCVRDAALGIAPEDWDICTSALPEQTANCFPCKRIIETGLKHGTITVVIDNSPFEVTTYRRDGGYSDNRRPDTVEFVTDLKEDLSRRDFTLNAMAYNPDKGVVDFFGGKEDLEARVIRCVGEPDKRFHEDALRIMRALRFASVFGFAIEKETSDSILRNKELLHNIAAERVVIELNKLIVGDGVYSILSGYSPVIAEIIPEITAAKSVDYAPKDIAVRLALLLKVNQDTAAQAMRRLKYDNKTAEAVAELIFHRDEELHSERRHLKRWLSKVGEERLRQLAELKRANVLNQIDEIIEDGQCFSLNGLAVDGNDLISVGVPEGAEMGQILSNLLDMVIDEQVENDKEKLLALCSL